ncbi:thermonuclease family protein [Sphingomonas cavernae]|uniref:thermonuclease family protein n=1 Tax=Sphingomonas cavernae TaxID=2320861 RepID=UPI001600F425|nr:thermonuclease family protein [Sphingomonas cavernae]
MGRIRRYLRSTVALAILFALLLAYAWNEEIGIGARELFAGDAAVSVRDGDTFLIGKDEFRLSGIDAPEYHQSCTDAAGRPWDCGKQARLKLEALLRAPGLGCTPRARDQFGRAISTCRNEGSADIGEAMVRAGFAISPGGFGDAPYADAEREARAARQGVWQGSFVTPAEWRKANSRLTED